MSTRYHAARFRDIDADLVPCGEISRAAFNTGMKYVTTFRVRRDLEVRPGKKKITKFIIFLLNVDWSI